MSEFQTTVQKLSAILRGSGKLRLSPYQAVPAFVNCGALSGLKVKESLTMGKEENDNADADENNVSGQDLELEAMLHEFLSAAVWDILRGGFDDKEVTPGTTVTGSSFVIPTGFTFNKGYLIPYKNADGSAPTITAAIGSADAALTENDDYILQPNGDGSWNIVPLDSAGASSSLSTTAQTLTFTITYTPAASVTYKSGAKTEIPFVIAEITTKNDGVPFYFTGYKGMISGGHDLTYPKDSDADRRVKSPIKLKFMTDPLYHMAANGNGYLYELKGGYV